MGEAILTPLVPDGPPSPAQLPAHPRRHHTFTPSAAPEAEHPLTRVLGSNEAHFSLTLPPLLPPPAQFLPLPTNLPAKSHPVLSCLWTPISWAAIQTGLGAPHPARIPRLGPICSVPWTAFSSAQDVPLLPPSSAFSIRAALARRQPAVIQQRPQTRLPAAPALTLLAAGAAAFWHRETFGCSVLTALSHRLSERCKKALHAVVLQLGTGSPAPTELHAWQEWGWAQGDTAMDISEMREALPAVL